MKNLQNLHDIFDKNLFRIPDYQRGYAWGKQQLTEFWEDLLNLSSNKKHYTGVISTQKIPEEIWKNWSDERWLITRDAQPFTPYYVVDGQQRLTTISILMQCLCDAVEEYRNKGNHDIFTGNDAPNEIHEYYIAKTNPKANNLKAYMFGYEKDNPSSKFMRYRIFNEKNYGEIEETFYTLNLEEAKKFFKENITLLIKNEGLEGLKILYKKLTQDFLFNVYEIDENFDVYVAFETMNNRGKQLSNLELLKNRLIYLTTLYPINNETRDKVEQTRKDINATWAEIYKQLGRKKKSVLKDDEFLRAHWIMYFKYTRTKGDDYIDFLLNRYFSPKFVFEKIEIKTNQAENYEEISDAADADYEDVADEESSVNNSKLKLTVEEINSYIYSLKHIANIWYITHFPGDSDQLTDEERITLDRLNRVKIAYFRPLITSILYKFPMGDPQRLEALKTIERFIFICFRLGRALSNYGSSEYYRAAKSIYFDEIKLSAVIKSLEEKIEGFLENDKLTFKSGAFRDFIERKFKSGEGFYGWQDLRYFLFEYEEHLRNQSKRDDSKLRWIDFNKSDDGKISIEHIYPQTADSEYWKSRFSSYSLDEQNFLKGSLGNLLSLKSRINSSLQNDDFPDKANGRVNPQGEMVQRVAYRDGSYSETEVARSNDWSPEEILQRGLRLLSFLESRWRISFGDDDKKTSLLHLAFLKREPGESPELNN
jgi:uncharacterized protein with ParB-like and HNH nuclease domain